MNTKIDPMLNAARAGNRALLSVTLTALACLAVACLLCGCAHERVVLRAAQTNDVPVLVTNLAPDVVHREVVSTRLNPVPGGPDILTTNLVAETNLVRRVETNLIRVITPEVAYTNVSLNPAVGAAVQIGGAVAPVPWAGAAAGLLGTITGGIFALINKRSERKALAQRGEAISKAEVLHDTAKILVENFELVRAQAKAIPAYTDSIDRQLMRVVEATQAAAGVKGQIEDLVSRYTETTAETPPLVPVLAPAAPVPVVAATDTVLPAPATAAAPAPVERPEPGDPPNRPLSELIAFSKSGQAPKRSEFSASDILSILEMRGNLS